MTALTIRGLSKSYTLHAHGGRPRQVVADLSLSLEFGRLAALEGPTGAGKSTVLRLIAGAARADAGEIWVSAGPGQPPVEILALPDRARDLLRRRQIAYATQALRVIPRLGLRRLLREAQPDAPEPAIAALLEALDLPPALWDLPPARFSGGEQARVTLALALIRRAPLLLLDEPTASLDRAHRDAVVDLIRAEKARGAAILLISHDPEVLDALADQRHSLAPL